MSEFKFACPVCGQHITADSSTSGGQIDCPTCFQKIVVPQAPASADTKFILSAAQVAKPRPASADAASQLAPLQSSPRPTSLPLVAALLVAAVRGRRGAVPIPGPHLQIPRAHPRPPAPTPSCAQPTTPVPLNTNYPVPTNISWTLDLTNAVFPGHARRGQDSRQRFPLRKGHPARGTIVTGPGQELPLGPGNQSLPLCAPGRGIERQDRRGFPGPTPRPARRLCAGRTTSSNPPPKPSTTVTC